MTRLLGRFLAHSRGLYPTFFWLPPIAFLGWPLYCLLCGERRWELGVVAILGGVVPYIGERSKKFFLGILPLGLVALAYDVMRFFEHAGVSTGRIHVCDLRQLEVRYFGVLSGGVRGTLHDVVQAHPSLPLDVFFSIPYGTFLYAIAAFAVFLYFRSYETMRRFMWAFFALNVVGLTTHHLLPSAPPWYYHAHGCLADTAVRASEGPNLARVDAWLGVPYFHGIYARSHEVFGAFPSLHVAYPTLIALEGWSIFGRMPRKKWLLRAASLAFVLWMSTAAVYLDHHWVLDVLAGEGLSIAVFAGARVSFRRAAREEEPSPQEASG